MTTSTPTGVDALLATGPHEEPVIAGTRIRVQTIASLWRQGYSAEWIWEQWDGYFSRAQVFAALAFYLENRERLDADLLRIQADYDDAEKVAAPLRSKF